MEVNGPFSLVDIALQASRLVVKDTSKENIPHTLKQLLNRNNPFNGATVHFECKWSSVESGYIVGKEEKAHQTPPEKELFL